MTVNEYQRAALKTASPVAMATKGNMLLQGVMGMCGEAGEAIDIVKKHYYQGHNLDKAHLAEELGDVLWYVATTAKVLGYDLESIMQMNIAKLDRRYGEQFDADKSRNRGGIRHDTEG